MLKSVAKRPLIQYLRHSNNQQFKHILDLLNLAIWQLPSLSSRLEEGFFSTLSMCYNLLFIYCTSEINTLQKTNSISSN